jgi:hypothetical protein
LGRETRRLKAREATAEEIERLWPVLVRRYGGFEVYKQRTERHIPGLILEPV